jgi:steroid delta-isomerase
MPNPDDLKALVERYAERFSAADREGWLDLWAPDGTMEDPVGTPVKMGRDEIGAFYDQSLTMADSVRLVPAGIVVATGDEIAWTVEIRPTIGGTEYVMDVIELMRVTEGPDGQPLIQEMRAFWDPSSMRPA